MNTEANKGKDGRNGTRKINLIKTSKKENLIEKILKHEVQKRKKDNEITVNLNVQEKDFSLNQSKVEGTSNPPVNTAEENKNRTEGKKKILRQLEAQSILERIKREVITKHLDNLGAESRKRSPTTRDLNIHRTQPIQKMLDQEVSSRVIPISAGDAFLRNMSKSPELNKSKSPTSNIPSINNSQLLNIVSIRIPSKEDREVENLHANVNNPSNLVPYQFQTNTYNHFKIDNLDSVRFKQSTHEALHKTNSENFAKRFIPNAKQDNKFRKEVKFQLETYHSQSQDRMEKEKEESKPKVDLQIKMLKKEMENFDDSNEFDLITDIDPQKYTKDTIVVSAGKTANNTFLVGDPNDSRYLKKKVFYEIYGKFSNRLSDFLLRKQKPGSRRQSQTKKEEKQEDINEKMKKNRKRTKFNVDVSENILKYRNIFKNQRSPDISRQKIIPDESINSKIKYNINTLNLNLGNSNNTSVISRENHELPFKKIVLRGGVIPFRSTPTRLREKEVVIAKKFNKHDVMKVPQRVMENAAKFIQIVWREHYKIKKESSIKIQSVWRGSLLRVKVRSVIYDYFLLQNKIINLEKLISQKFYKEFMLELFEIKKIKQINRKKNLKCIILLQKNFKKFFYKKYPIRQKFIFERQSSMTFAKSEKMILSRIPFKAEEEVIPKPILRILSIPSTANILISKFNKMILSYKISLIQKFFRESILMNRKIHREALYKRIIAPKIFTKKHIDALDTIIKVIKLQRKWKQVAVKKQILDRIRNDKNFKMFSLKLLNRISSFTKEYKFISSEPYKFEVEVHEKELIETKSEKEPINKLASDFKRPMRFKRGNPNMQITKSYKTYWIKKIIKLQIMGKTFVKKIKEKPNEILPENGALIENLNSNESEKIVLEIEPFELNSNEIIQPKLVQNDFKLFYTVKDFIETVFKNVQGVQRDCGDELQLNQVAKQDQPQEEKTEELYNKSFRNKTQKASHSYRDDAESPVRYKRLSLFISFTKNIKNVRNKMIKNIQRNYKSHSKNKNRLASNLNTIHPIIISNSSKPSCLEEDNTMNTSLISDAHKNNQLSNKIQCNIYSSKKQNTLSYIMSGNKDENLEDQIDIIKQDNEVAKLEVDKDNFRENSKFVRGEREKEDSKVLSVEVSPIDYNKSLQEYLENQNIIDENKKEKSNEPEIVLNEDKEKEKSHEENHVLNDNLEKDKFIHDIIALNEKKERKKSIEEMKPLAEETEKENEESKFLYENKSKEEVYQDNRDSVDILEKNNLIDKIKHLDVEEENEKLHSGRALNQETENKNIERETNEIKNEEREKETLIKLKNSIDRSLESVPNKEIEKKLLILSENNFNFEIISNTIQSQENPKDNNYKKPEENNNLGRNESSLTRNLNSTNYSTNITEILKDDRRFLDINARYSIHTLQSFNFLPSEKETTKDDKPISNKELKSELGINNFHIFIPREDKEISETNKDINTKEIQDLKKEKNDRNLEASSENLSFKKQKSFSNDKSNKLDREIITTTNDYLQRDEIGIKGHENEKKIDFKNFSQDFSPIKQEISHKNQENFTSLSVPSALLVVSQIPQINLLNKENKELKPLSFEKSSQEFSIIKQENYSLPKENQNQVEILNSETQYSQNYAFTNTHSIEKGFFNLRELVSEEFSIYDTKFNKFDENHKPYKLLKFTDSIPNEHTRNINEKEFDEIKENLNPSFTAEISSSIKETKEIKPIILHTYYNNFSILKETKSQEDFKLKPFIINKVRNCYLMTKLFKLKEPIQLIKNDEIEKHSREIFHEEQSGFDLPSETINQRGPSIEKRSESDNFSIIKVNQTSKTDEKHKENTVKEISEEKTLKDYTTETVEKDTRNMMPEIIYNNSTKADTMQNLEKTQIKEPKFLTFKTSRQNMFITKINSHHILKKIFKIQRFIKLIFNKSKKFSDEKQIIEKENVNTNVSTSGIMNQKLTPHELSKIHHSRSLSSTMFITRAFDYLIINETNPTQNDTKDVNLNINVDSIIQHEAFKPILLDVSDCKHIEIREEKEITQRIFLKLKQSDIHLWRKIYKMPTSKEILKIQRKWREYSTKNYIKIFNTEINPRESAAEENLQNSDPFRKSEIEPIQDSLFLSKLYQKSSSSHFFKRENLECLEKLVKQIQMKRRTKNYKSDSMQITINSSVDFIQPSKIEKVNCKGPILYKKILYNSFATKEILSNSEGSVNSFIFYKADNINLNCSQDEIKLLRKLNIPLLHSNIKFNKESKHFNNKNIVKIQRKWKQIHRNRNYIPYSNIKIRDETNDSQLTLNILQEQPVIPIIKKFISSILYTKEIKNSIFSNVEDIERKRGLQKVRRLSKSQDYDNEYITKFKNIPITINKISKSVKFTKSYYRSFIKPIESIQRKWRESKIDIKDIQIEPIVEMIQKSLNSSLQKSNEMNIPIISHIDYDDDEFNHLNDTSTLVAKKYMRYLVNKIVHIKKDLENLANNLKNTKPTEIVSKGESLILIKKISTTCNFTKEIENASSYKMLFHIQKIWRHYNLDRYSTIIKRKRARTVSSYNYQILHSEGNILFSDPIKLKKNLSNINYFTKEIKLSEKKNIPDNQTYRKKSRNKNYDKDISIENVDEVVISVPVAEMKKDCVIINEKMKKIDKKTFYEKDLKANYLKHLIIIQKLLRKHISKRLRNALNEHPQQSKTLENFSIEINHQTDYQIERVLKGSFVNSSVFNYEIIKPTINNLKQPTLFHYITKEYKFHIDRKLGEVQNTWKQHKTSKMEFKSLNNKKNHIQITANKPKEIFSPKVTFSEIEITSHIDRSKIYKFKINNSSQTILKCYKLTNYKKIVKIQRKLKNYLYSRRNSKLSSQENGEKFKAVEVIHLNTEVPTNVSTLSITKDIHLNYLVDNKLQESSNNLANLKSVKEKSKETDEKKKQEILNDEEKKYAKRIRLFNVPLLTKENLNSSHKKIIDIQKKYRKFNHKFYEKTNENVSSLKISKLIEAQSINYDAPIVELKLSHEHFKKPEQEPDKLDKNLQANSSSVKSPLLIKKIKSFLYSKSNKNRITKRIIDIQRIWRKSKINIRFSHENDVFNRNINIPILSQSLEFNSPNIHVIKKQELSKINNLVSEKEYKINEIHPDSELKTTIEPNIESMTKKVENHNKFDKHVEEINNVFKLRNTEKKSTFDKNDIDEELQKELKSIPDQQNYLIDLREIPNNLEEREIIEDNQIENPENINNETHKSEIREKTLSADKFKFNVTPEKDSRALSKKESKVILKSQEFSVSISTAPKEDFIKLIKTLNKITKQDTLNDLREYQLDHMAKELLAYLVNKKRLSQILSSLQETNTRIRSLDLIYRLITNFKNAAGRFILDNIKLNISSSKNTDKNKHMIEIMHKQMTINYMNAIQELYKNKIESLNKFQESKIEHGDQELKVGIYSDDLKKELKMPYKRNVYSYGWYQKIEPRAIPFYPQKNDEEKILLNTMKDKTVEEDKPFCVSPSRNVMTNYLKNALKRGNLSASLNPN